ALESRPAGVDQHRFPGRRDEQRRLSAFDVDEEYVQRCTRRCLRARVGERQQRRGENDRPSAHGRPSWSADSIAYSMMPVPDSAGGSGCAAAGSAAAGPLPLGLRLRRGRISYRLIISFSVVGLMWSSSAARFWTPPAASSVDSMSRFSKSVMTSLQEMPSGGTTN